MSYKKRFKLIKKLKITSQIIFFLAFVFIFIRSLDPFNIIFNPFLRYDPLIFLTHFNINFIIPVATLLLLTLIFGRFFCGWICPLGFLIDILDLILKPLHKIFLKKIRFKNKGIFEKINIYPPSWVILGAIIVTIFTATPILQLFHPNIWIIRIFSLSKAGLIFLGLLLLFSLISNRLWCRYLCPLGALYGLLAKFSFFRLRITKCISCGICSSCPMDAIDYNKRVIHAHQCILCFNHEYKCPVNGFSFKLSIKMDETYDKSRRDFLKQSILLVSGIVVGGLSSISKNNTNSKLLRPPGVQDEEDFVKRCLRCFQCVESCPNDIIKITTIETGLFSFLTPHLVFNEYGCDYNCQVCQLACPNYAIPLQTLEKKQLTKIGTAKIDRDLCVVYNKGISCIVCEEFCPTSPKAVLLDVKKLIAANRPKIELKYPSVDTNLCIGCGICEANCPVNPKAIKVYKYIS